MSDPVIFIGLDAMDHTTVEELCAEGRLPALAALRARGRRGTLGCFPESFLSMVWPTFNSGTPVPHHGWYLNKIWRAENQRVEYAKPGWLPQQPFWDLLPPDTKLALLDVPFAAAPPRAANGVYLNGWQNHDDFGRTVVPRGLWRDLRRRFGKPALGAELFGPQTEASLAHTRAEALGSIDQFAKVSAHLLGREPWDLFVTVFGGGHRATHYLWHDAAARDEIYAALDRALARVLDAAPPHAHVLVGALHGMGPNSGWFERFTDMVGLIQRDGAPAAPKRGLLYRVKKALPWQLVRQITTRLPSAVNQALVPLWSRRMCDWSQTRYFVVPGDLNGYIRVNLRGREPQGIVAPGAEYDALLDELEGALASFRDVATGEPVVRRVVRAQAFEGARRDRLPDLVVEWNDTIQSGASTGIRSERYGELRWPEGAATPSGRTGNHRGPGWFVAAGPGIEPGTCRAPADVVDLAPTLFRLLGAPLPEAFTGAPIPELAAASRRAAPA